jgi:phage-related baseplate assembly protein
MPLTLDQLRTPITTAEALQTMLDNLEALGFNVTSWQSGSVQRTFLQGVAITWSSLTNTVDSLSRILFNDSAEGTALTELSDSHYDNQRITSVSAEGDYTLTGGAVGPPHAVAIGALIVADAAGRVYRNTTAATVPASGTDTCTIKADIPGTDGNVANDTITTLQTPFAGVTGSNSAIAPASTWITTQGIDAEADAVLRARNTSKWATLASAAPADTYVNWALEADTDVARVLVDDDNPRGSGTLDVYIARATGAAVGADVTAVQAYIDDRRPVTADPEVSASTAVAQNFTATVYVTAALNNAAKQAEIEQAITDYVNGLPIGGTVIPPGTAGFALFSEMNQAISAVVGVENIAWTTPVADVAITANRIMTMGAITFTYTDI